ncbi:hypothetical protein [Gluconobacter albidus]|uniref:hypothetical protein n=1 Tax=Gluconobacter albidus TaxID=318683 RepID=UPI0024E1382E|nr:hypothetical protein [Gluconobacter albidus]
MKRSDVIAVTRRSGNAIWVAAGLPEAPPTSRFVIAAPFFMPYRRQTGVPPARRML